MLLRSEPGPVPGSLPPQQRGGDGSLLPPGPVASAVPSWGHFLEWGNKDWKRRTRKGVIWVYWASSLFFFPLRVAKPGPLFV